MLCLGGAFASLWFFWMIGSAEAGTVAAIRVTAAPEVVLADGISTSIIRADARDESGLAAPDGTELTFQTTLGTMPTTGQTVGGIVQATLLSPTEPGAAIVTVTNANVRSQVEVEFIAPGEISSRESGVISVDAGWVGYDVGQGMLTALQDVRLAYRGWEIDAKTSLYLDVRALEVLAREASVSTSRGRAEGFSLRARFTGSNLKGHLLKIDDEMHLYEFGDRSLALQPADEALTAELFWPPKTGDNSFWVKAKDALIFPGQKIALRRAELYLGETRFLTMPYYVLSLDRLSAPLPDYVDYSSLGGFSVNVPLHYAVTERRTGLVRLRRGRRTDWFSARPGWSVGIEEQYSRGRDQEGSVTLEGLLRKDWGGYWNHHQRYADGTDGYFSLGYPSNHLLYGSAASYGRRRDYTFVGRADASKLPGQPVSYNTGGSWRSFSRPLGKTKWSYYGTFDLGLLTQPNSNRAVLQQQERLALFPKRLSLGKETGLSLRTDFSVVADSSGGRGSELVGRLAIDHSLGRTSRASLAYVYQENRGNVNLPSPPRQQLSANLSWSNGLRGDGYLSSSYDLSSHFLTAFANASLSLPQSLSIRLLSQYFTSPSGDYVDNQVSLVKNIWGRAVALGWSQSRHRLWLELLPEGF